MENKLKERKKMGKKKIRKNARSDNRKLSNNRKSPGSRTHSQTS